MDGLLTEPFRPDGKGIPEIPSWPALGVELAPESVAPHSPDPAAPAAR